MADTIISAVVGMLADFLPDQAKNQIDLLTGVEREVQTLEDTLKRIQAVLADAEQRMIRDKTVEAWLHELEDLSYEMDDVLDEWNYMILKQQIEGSSNEDRASPSTSKKQRVSEFISSSYFRLKQVPPSHQIASKINELKEKLDLIDKRKNQFAFITSIGVATSNSQEWKRVQSFSFIDASKVCGRVHDKDSLINLLLSEEDATQILSIVGAGGIGKTTLAQLAYNDNQVKHCFENKAWVCVSDPFDEIRVAKAIIQSLESSSPNLDELDPLLNRIRDSISGKRILFVFDDVWTEERMKWEPFQKVPTLKDVEDEDAATLTSRAIKSFPKLIQLKFDYCGGWKEWEDIGPENETDDAVPLIFPRLRQLRINSCEKLEVLPHRLLRKASSLEYIWLNGEGYDDRSTILSFLDQLEAAESATTEAAPQG